MDAVSRARLTAFAPSADIANGAPPAPARPTGSC